MTETNQEIAFIELYMKDAENASSITEDEREDLIIRLAEGDAEVCEDLINSMILYVADKAQNYRDKGVHFGDLVQDANLAMMDIINDYEADADEFYNLIDEAITEAFESAIEDHQKVAKASEELAEKLNKLHDVTSKLSKDLGRLPAAKELADAMGCDEDEVAYLLKASIDAMSINEDTHLMDDLSSINDTLKMDDDEDFSKYKDDEDPLDWNF